MEGCFDSADQRARSAREGFTSFESALEAQRACIARHPDAPRVVGARTTLATLESERNARARARAQAQRSYRLALADDYRDKANLQYALGASFAIVAAGAAAGAATFVLAQPLGKDDIKNTIGGSICLGFAIIFGVETYLRFDQGITHAKSAKNIRPLAFTPSGVALRF